jgi:hypothetical protein
MKGQFLKVECPRCKYPRAEKSFVNDGGQEHFICHRCGYLRMVYGEKVEEHHGLGVWMCVIKQGIVASAVYIDKQEFDNKIDEIKKTFQNGKLFYTKAGSIGGYLLIDAETGIKYPFGDDDEVCFEGLRKITSVN